MPQGLAGSLEFAKLLLKKAKVCVSPGIGFGEYGDEHVRFAPRKRSISARSCFSLVTVVSMVDI